jgi:D-lactate dehydrogenase (cytochrome)
MDAIDLFIGSEGTLGVITEAVLRVIDRPVRSVALVTCRSDQQALTVTTALREQARLAWVGRGSLDVSAIEYMDHHSLRVMPDAAFENAGIVRPPAGSSLLLVQMEVTQGEADALTGLADVLDAARVEADPLVTASGDERGAQRLFQLREAVPASVNAIVAAAKQRDDRVEKTAGDVIVPFDALAPALEMYRAVLELRGLDYAIWGHVSDGNLHVNVLPRHMDDVMEGREALVEVARRVIGMGGSPLAEHGVGRSGMKQRLLRELYGEDGIEQMRRVKRALDPDWKLAPGVLFARSSADTPP